jgi:hypothetical protein
LALGFRGFRLQAIQGSAAEPKAQSPEPKAQRLKPFPL